VDRGELLEIVCLFGDDDDGNNGVSSESLDWLRPRTEQQCVRVCASERERERELGQAARHY
jgi:hypothetical protein